MKNKALWMARLLRAHGPLSKQEIREAWRQEDPAGKPMANSTFYDNLWVLESRYNLPVSRSGHRFRLEAGSQEESDLYAQLFEQQEPTDHLALLAMQVEIEQAAQRHVKLQLDYQPPNKSGYRMTLWPYGLHQAGQWTYVTGWSERHGEVRTFALDRIRHLETTALKFTPPPDFNAARYFRHSFGAFYRPGQEPEPIVLLADAALQGYLRQRPLHPSQRLVPVDGRHCRVELCLVPSADFTARLLSYGPSLEVLSPPALRHHLGHLLRLAADRYLTEPDSPADPSR